MLMIQVGEEIKMNQYINDYTLTWNVIKTTRRTVTIQRKKKLLLRQSERDSIVGCRICTVL